MHYLGLDIGGANIKVADGLGYARSYPFALWQKPNELAQELRMVISEAPPSVHLAVTMTGELADCFATKAEGVKFILEALQTASDNRHTRVYLCDGRMVTPQVALLNPMAAAASNWHVLAQFASRFVVRETSLLIDIGSTTTDIIPIVAGKPKATGTTDTTRLLNYELVYTGVERTPVCGLVSQVPYRGEQCPVALEYFATMYDVYLLLEQMPENPLDVRTADGRPATKKHARDRMARVIAADCEEFNHRDAIAIAEAVAEAQLQKIAAAVRQVVAHLPQPPQSILLSGQGEYLGLKVLEHLPPVPRVVRLSREIDPLVSRCAPAHALAVLAREAHGA
jgi:(4-(4-[2-(gamma-L-glutamylamino)ethyl]phenoxymethyl)furan-2-yl)methanamine synthase